MKVFVSFSGEVKYDRTNQRPCEGKWVELLNRKLWLACKQKNSMRVWQSGSSCNSCLNFHRLCAAPRSTRRRGGKRDREKEVEVNTTVCLSGRLLGEMKKTVRVSDRHKKGFLRFAASLGRCVSHWIYRLTVMELLSERRVAGWGRCQGVGLEHSNVKLNPIKLKWNKLH